MNKIISIGLSLISCSSDEIYEFNSNKLISGTNNQGFAYNKNRLYSANDTINEVLIGF